MNQPQISEINTTVSVFYLAKSLQGIKMIERDKRHYLGKHLSTCLTREDVGVCLK